MTFSAALALFGSMVVLALLPGPGILVVVSRTLSQGWRAGVICTAGIVSGDFVFIGLALVGLSSLAQTHAELFAWVRYGGAVYLIYLGASLVFPHSSQEEPHRQAVWGSHSVSYFAGLLTTLSNPKAILFYASFFPSFIHLGALTLLDVALLLAITTLAVGGVMLSYVWLANHSGELRASSTKQTAIRWISCFLLCGTGLYIASL